MGKAKKKKQVRIKPQKKVSSKKSVLDSAKHDEGVPITILTFVGDYLREIANLIGERAPTTVELLKERKLTLTELMKDLKYVLDTIKRAKKWPACIFTNGPDQARGKAEEALSILSRVSYPLLNCYEAMYDRGAKADINLVYKRWVTEYKKANLHCEKLEVLAAWFHKTDYLIWSGMEHAPKETTLLDFLRRFCNLPRGKSPQTVVQALIRANNKRIKLPEFRELGKCHLYPTQELNDNWPTYKRELGVLIPSLK